MYSRSEYRHQKITASIFFSKNEKHKNGSIFSKMTYMSIFRLKWLNMAESNILTEFAVKIQIICGFTVKIEIFGYF